MTITVWKFIITLFIYYTKPDGRLEITKPMEYVLIIITIIVFLIIWSAYQAHVIKQKRRACLKEQWGKPHEQDITSEKLQSLKTFYHSRKDDQVDIDDITWNDLDMDEIFFLMNHTQSSIGEEYLYSLLRKPCFDKAELEERNRIMNFFGEQESSRLQVQMKLYPIGKISKISVYEYISRLGELKAKSNLSHYLMLAGLILSVILIFIYPPAGGVLTVLFLANNIFQYYREKATMEAYLTVFSYICRLLDGAKEIYRLNLPELKNYTAQLEEDCHLFRKFQRGSVWVTPKQNSGSFEDILLDYARMLFHIDLILFHAKLNFFKMHRTVLIRIYETIGFLDSMTAAASFREMLPCYCVPELELNKKPFIKVTDLYHPLIANPVPNSISGNQSVLITGSNASGKSTFIKTLALNAILAQTIDTSISSRYQASFYKIYSSMALRDNIFSRESYYMVEIKSLKRILDHFDEEIPSLCFIDEVLRGTNTLERIAASSRILSYMAKKNALIFAATHDIELTHILDQEYDNYHFQERIEKDEVLFDYQLYQGKAVSKNAIRLLDILNFPKDIIIEADKAAADFLETGDWIKSH